MGSRHYTAPRCIEWIRAASGISDLQPEIRSIGKWRMNSTLATHLVSGRIVLCGDAAHQCPPTGGLGVNNSIRGVHNVIWKLVMFITSRAGHDLLKTYEDEHRPVVLQTNEQSHQNHRRVSMIARSALHPDSGSKITARDVVIASQRYGNQIGIELALRTPPVRSLRTERPCPWSPTRTRITYPQAVRAAVLLTCGLELTTLGCPPATSLAVASSR